ncbi:ATP-binding protein [Nonomuraea aridisoli]|nr:ATP-binding protein [Nonomuraea aridisoli]
MALPPGPLSAPPIHTVECLLPSVPAAVGEARSLIRAELVRWGRGHEADDCLVIVSELATNAVRYGGSAYALRLEDRGDRLYGEVFDPGEGEPRPRSPDVESLSGRGLQIVAALADEWGVTAARGGKAVWFFVGRTA